LPALFLKERSIKMKKIHEVVGTFNELNKMEEAIGELEASGFNRLNISVLGNQAALQNAFGNKIPNVKQLGENVNTPRSANIAGEELGLAQGLIIGGGLVAGIAAIALTAGATLTTGSVVMLILGGGSGVAIGGCLASMLGDKYAAFFQQQIDSGGLLLWVGTHSKADEKKASAIYKKYGADNVHVHALA
jgi:hypothetical protein